jgi:hypothetical protein
VPAANGRRPEAADSFTLSAKFHRRAGMPDKQLYSDVLTEEEKELGFALVQTANPLGGFAGEGVAAVVLPINRHDRIVKFHGPPTGKPRYRIQRFGAWPGQSPEQAGWKPLYATAYPTPRMALRAVQAGAEESVGAPVALLLPPVLPCDPGEQY